jgi:signal peptidase II
MRRLLTGALAFLVVLAADQASKDWVLHHVDLPDVGSIVLLPFLSFTMVWNHGVTFGLLAQFGALGALGPWLLAGVALAVVAVLFRWLLRAETWPVALALGGIAGGAVGNVIDRLRFGAVVDFIDAHAFGHNWYVFNVADAAIVCGVATLLLDGMVRRDPKRDDPRGRAA